MRKALTLSGSIRNGSYNQMLQAHMDQRLAAAGFAVTHVDLSDHDMPIFNEDLEPDHIPQTARVLADLIRDHEIIFVATPEYNGGLPPLLVNTFAWLSRIPPSVFRGRIWGIGGVSSGKYGTISALSHLRDSISKVGGLVVPGLLGIGPAEGAFGADGAPLEKSVNGKIDQMIAAFQAIRLN
ncbi:MAG: NAD(P)H-dependent oxidoreductase [Hyphomicrobiaceae bacterium]|nr:NAD(P)H-dependent oxidoreductase [Hyphomicrobiaceae bacterium]